LFLGRGIFFFQAAIKQNHQSTWAGFGFVFAILSGKEGTDRAPRANIKTAGQ